MLRPSGSIIELKFPGESETLFENLTNNLGIGQRNVAHNLIGVVPSPPTVKLFYNKNVLFDSYHPKGLLRCRN